MKRSSNTISSDEFDFDLEEKIVEPVKTFTKKQFVESQYYIDKRDALNALLDYGQRYSISEVNKILDVFYGGAN